MRFSFTLWLCLCAFSLFAQQDITVEVYDYVANAPAAEVPVTLSNPGQGIVRTANTNAQGKVTFRAVPPLPGYVVSTPETEAFLESQSESFDLRSNQDRSIQLVLLANRSIDLEEATVTATSNTRVNRQDAEVAFELTQAEIKALPIEGRDITQALYRLPNVSRATGFFPEAPPVAINGANSLFTSYLIDGMDNNERFLGGQKFAVPTGFARNVTVLTNNYSAEYGLSNNGVINITSRSGSNDLTGEVFTQWRPSSGDLGPEDFTLRDLSGNPVRDGFQRIQGGVALGGAIKKDKTFFYVDLEHTTDLKDNALNSPLLNVAETVQGRNVFNFLSGKIDHNWNSRWRSSLRANVGLVSIERQGGGLEGGVTFPSAANEQDRNSFLLANQNTYLGRSFSAQTNVQYARFRWNYAGAPNPNSPQVTVLGPSDEAIAVLGHPGFVFDQEENTLQLQQKFSIYLGKHTLKTGINLISSDHQLSGGGVPAGSYVVRLNEAQLAAINELNRGSALSINDIPSDVEVRNYNVELRPNSFGTRQTITSLYIEDQWAATEKLNLTAGLRYDYDNLSKGGAEQGDFNNIAPRLNFNYALDRKSVIRGGYGIFYDKVLYAVYSDALQQNTTDAGYRAQLRELVRQGILPADTDIERITFDGNLTATAGTAVGYLNGPTAAQLQGQREGVFSGERRILNPNGYDNPYTHQFALGYQYQVDKRTLFYVDLVHNRSENLYRLRNLNAPSAYPVIDPDNVVVRSPADADLSRPIPIVNGRGVIQGDTISGVARNVTMTEAGGKSRYLAASFVLAHEAGDLPLSWRINYTLGRLENDTEDINFRAADANNFEAEFGPSINDRRHIINGIATYTAPFGLDLTLAALLQSGQPINRIPDARIYGTADLNGDGGSFGDAYVGNSDRYPGVGRNADRLPWAYNFDLSLRYTIKLKADTRALQIRADVFNLFDRRNLSGYANNATQSNQIQVGPVGAPIVQRNADQPRQFQLGVSYLFGPAL